MIDDGENTVVPSAFGETHDQIHRHLCEWGCTLGDGDSVGGDACSVSKVFVLLALGTSLDVCLYPVPHSWPIESLGYFSSGLVSAWVSVEPVMVLVKDHPFDLVVWWDGESFLVVVPETAAVVEFLVFEPALVGFLGVDEHRFNRGVRVGVHDV